MSVPVRETRVRLCTAQADGSVYGLETAAVAEAFAGGLLRPVPMAPAFVGGVLPYRGEVLLAVSLRVILGLPPAPAGRAPDVQGFVLRDTGTGESYALLVDAVLDVEEVDEADWEPNPPTLDGARAAIFAGLYRRNSPPLIRLAPERLQPSALQAKPLAVQRPGVAA